MKRIRIAILLLLIPLCCVAFAALTKTTSIVELDAWKIIDAGLLDVGNAGDISGSYDTILYLEIAYTDIDGQDGVEVSIEVSYGDDDWTLLTTFTTLILAGGAETTTLNGAVTAGDTVITLTDASGFDVNGQKWFIEDGTVANSESVRTKSEAGGTVTLCHDMLRNHDNSETVWEFVHEYIIPIPAAFAFVRVIINNVDANADIHYTTRISKVQGYRRQYETNTHSIIFAAVIADSAASRCDNQNDVDCRR